MSQKCKKCPTLGQFTLYIYIYLTLDHKTSHKGLFFFFIEIYASSESGINKFSIDVLFVRTIFEIQLFVNLESEGAKKSKY